MQRPPWLVGCFLFPLLSSVGFESFLKLASVCYWPYFGINPVFIVPVRKKSRDFLSSHPLTFKLSLGLLEVCLRAVSLWWPRHCSPACEHPVHVHGELQEQSLLTAGLAPVLGVELLANGVKFQFHRAGLGTWTDFGDFESCCHTARPEKLCWVCTKNCSDTHHKWWTHLKNPDKIKMTNILLRVLFCFNFR